MRLAQIGSTACLYISILLISGCATPDLISTSAQASNASLGQTPCPQSNGTNCSNTATPYDRGNCRPLPEDYDPAENDPRVCPAENVWGTGARRGYQCCKKPPV
jgi:hypothetical protein